MGSNGVFWTPHLDLEDCARLVLYSGELEGAITASFLVSAAFEGSLKFLMVVMDPPCLIWRRKRSAGTERSFERGLRVRQQPDCVEHSIQRALLSDTDVFLIESCRFVDNDTGETASLVGALVPDFSYNNSTLTSCPSATHFQYSFLHISHASISI